MYLSMCGRLFKIMNNSTEVDPSSYRDLVKILVWLKNWHHEIQTTMPDSRLHHEHWKNLSQSELTKGLLRSIRAFLGLVQYIQINYPNSIIIPKTMCQDDVENYFSLLRAHIASAQLTVLYFESATTLNTNLLLTSEFNELNDSTGSYDPVCIPNAVKMPLLRRSKSTCSSESKLPLCSDSSSSNHSFLPL